jgi:hypothetical protein
LIEKLAEKNEALDDFARRFLKMKSVAEPLIDAACSSS